MIRRQRQMCIRDSYCPVPVGVSYDYCPVPVGVNYDYCPVPVGVNYDYCPVPVGVNYDYCPVPVGVDGVLAVQAACVAGQVQFSPVSCLSHSHINASQTCCTSCCSHSPQTHCTCLVFYAHTLTHHRHTARVLSFTLTH